MEATNQMYMKFDAKSVNESLARMTVAAFMMEMNPTLDEIQDVKTAVSEAVTNAIVHGYSGEIVNECPKEIEMICRQENQTLIVSVIDYGIGIADIEEARQPFFTTKPDEERSGMGFAFMETFMDTVEIESQIGVGTKITMIKYIGREGE